MNQNRCCGTFQVRGLNLNSRCNFNLSSLDKLGGRRGRRTGRCLLLTIFFTPCAGTIAATFFGESLSEFIQRWCAVGSRCVCETIGTQVLPDSKRPQYMECYAGSKIGVEATKPVLFHSQFWQHPPDLRNTRLFVNVWNQRPERFPVLYNHFIPGSIKFWSTTIAKLCFLLFASLQKNLKEMLVVVLPCFVAKRINTLHCPTFASGASACSELLQTAALAYFPKYIYLVHLSTLQWPKQNSQILPWMTPWFD